MKTVSVAHLSDLHLPYDPALTASQRLSKRQLSAWAWRRRRHIHRTEILAALGAELRAAEPDHIAITGDLINFALPQEFRQAASWLEALAPADRISVVPGNHDALVPVADSDGLRRWSAWSSADGAWPYVHRRHGLALIGVNSALPTAPLLARGRIGTAQLARLEDILHEERRSGRVRVVLVHHAPADAAANWRRALADRAALRAVLARAGAEIVLHGHAREPRLDAVPGPQATHGMIPCVCVPSSSAAANAHDAPARWHWMRFDLAGQVDIAVREWSAAAGCFVASGGYRLCLPRRGAAAEARFARGSDRFQHPSEIAA
jgi:3',5'-cyclic AMP phosphodiesterase CpdA